MNTEIKLPNKIQRLVAGKSCTADSTGMSEGSVLLYDDMVLKAEKHTDNAEAAIRMMQWLDGKIPVPKVICHEVQDGMSYLLMSRIFGKMSCDTYYLEHPHELTSLLAEGLRMLWSVDISDCPCEKSLESELTAARYNVEHGLVKIDRCEPDTFGENGFESPAHLLRWLEENQPVYEPALSHGDFCLPNVFVDSGKISGFIDLGDTGVADKWKDISLCYRSLKHNFDGTFGGKVYPDFDPDMLFEKLGIEPDCEKLRYYILLDELF